MIPKAGLLKAVAILSMLLLVPVALVSAATPPQPTYGTADVDGNTSEWDLTDDFFANMYRAADPSKTIESKLYLRYDCSSGTLYALVVAESGVTIRANQPSDSFIKLGNSNKLVDGNSGDDGTPPDFAWVGLSGDTASGWEASAALATGSYTNLNVHTQVNDGGSQTSAVEDRAIDLTIACVDFGDLPETSPYTDNPGYAGLTTLSNGARHVIGSLMLGSSVDAEADGQPNSTATGDGNPDEDGVVRTPGVLWTPGSTVSVDVTVTGGNGCLSGWIDWNNDGDFDDTFTSGATEHIITQQLVGTDQGVQPKTFSFLMPTTGSGGDIANLARTFFARFRLYPRDGNGVCSGVTESVTGEASDGEVEDYFWEFGTTAVTLAGLTARSSSGFPAGPAAAALAFLAGGVAIGGVLMRRRRES